MECFLTYNLLKFVDSLCASPRPVNNDESWSLGLTKNRFALKQACVAAGYGTRYYPARKGSDLLVTNRLDKASTQRLMQWAQGKVSAH